MTYFIASSSSLPADIHAVRRTASQEIDSPAPEFLTAPVRAPVQTGARRSVLAAGDGQARPDADHGQAAGAADQLEPPRGAGQPGAGGARHERPGAVRDHRDADED